MNCVIPGTSCKILARAIHALSRIGDEMYVEPRETSLSFRCVGMSHSAYCDFTFHDNFFSSYNLGNLEDQDAFKCKISMRSALTAFKSPAMIDKLVESCHIRLEPNAETLIFIFKFKNSVVKTFFLPIIDCEDLSVPYTKDNVPNKLSAKSRLFTDAVHNFQPNLVEMTVEVTSQKLLMRNYVDESSNVANSTRTQLVLTDCEFDKYDVDLEASITFSMKELRALLTFAESVGLAMNVYFETTGKPVVFDVKNPAFEVNLVLSTLNPDSDDMSVSTATDVRQSIRKRAPPKKRGGSKVSAKRPKNQSTVSNNTVNSRSSVMPATSLGTSTKNKQNQMEVDETSESNRTITNLQNNENNSNNDLSRIREVARVRGDFIQNPSTSRASSIRGGSGRSSPSVSSLGTPMSKETAPSIFSTNWNKRDDNSTTDAAMDTDAIPASPSPPARKASSIFKKCFQTTFDPRMLPGHEDILAEDTDEET